jgi:hypothetical protein
MHILLTDNLDELRHTLAAAEEALSDGVRHAVAAAVAEGAEEARSTHRFHNRSGDAERETRGVVEVSVPGGAVGFIECRVPYASFLDAGTAPHDITGWRGGFLRWESGGDVHFARVVHHPGTHADGFFGRAYQKAERVLEREAEVAAVRAQAALDR